MNIRHIRKWFKPLRRTPFHPQWLMHRDSDRMLSRLLDDTAGTVLDIGCADRLASRYVRNKYDYIGIDYYYTATDWYETVPDIYADAQALPLSGQSVGTVLLLDVLEHIREPELCVAEIVRVLEPLGKLVIQVPFLYPLHDVPLDFQRWTRYGLEQILAKHKLKIIELIEDGNSCETCALLTNLALSKLIYQVFCNRHPMLVLAVFLLILIPAINLLGYLAARILPDLSYMPFRYRIIATKAAHDVKGITLE